MSSRQPDRMMAPREGADLAATTERSMQVYQAAAQAAIAAVVNVAKQAQVPVDELPKMIITTLAKATEAVAKQGGILPDDVRSIVDQHIDRAVELRNRLARKAVEKLRAYVSGDTYSGDAITRMHVEAVALLAQFDAAVPTEPAPILEVEKPKTCGARWPVEGAECTLEPHEGGEHYDKDFDLRWT